MGHGAKARVGGWALAVALASLPGAVIAAPGAGAPVRVSLLEGKAEVERSGARRALQVGSGVSEGDAVETFDGARLELSMQDGSKLRLAPRTMLVLKQGRFLADGGRNVQVGLVLGNVWAKVAKALGAKDSFEVVTGNAVAGVRGTAFAVQAAADLSAVVRVYAGTVGVRKSAGVGGGARPARREVPGPERVDQQQWEEIIAGAMKAVRISAVGEIAPAEDFEDAGADKAWATWNSDRDRSK